MLTVAVSSRSLFHLEEANEIFEREGQKAYDAYMVKTENEVLEPGAAFDLVRKLLNLNSHAEPGSDPLVNVIMLSRTSTDAGVRIMKSIKAHSLNIDRAVFTTGANRFRFAQAMKADLFLCAAPEEARNALENGIAAASIYPSRREPTQDDVVRIALDGDAVIFSDESDAFYRANGLNKFIEHENQKENIPLGDGPFKNLLTKLHQLQFSLSKTCDGEIPLRIGLVTARGTMSGLRVLNTLRHWGLTVDETVFASGGSKGPILKAFGADFFFDDTGHNIESALEHNIAAGHVPFGRGGIVGALVSPRDTHEEDAPRPQRRMARP